MAPPAPAPLAPIPEHLQALEAHLRAVLRPEWLAAPYKDAWSPANPTLGFCSMAAEAGYFILGGGPAGWNAWAVREADGTSHWWLQHKSGVRWDPTADQFYQQGTVPPYERGLTGRACAFMGMREEVGSPWGFDRRPGLRAQQLLRALAHDTEQALDTPAHVATARRRWTHPNPPVFKDWAQSMTWSESQGVSVDIVENVVMHGLPESVDYLAAIDRHHHTPKGRGRLVMDALVAHADRLGRTMHLTVTGYNTVLEDYYNEWGFVAQEDHRDELGDVLMVRPPHPVARLVPNAPAASSTKRRP